MNNDEILINLNDETKTYIDEAFSYLDFFIQHDQDNSLEKYMGISFLISAIKNNEKVRKVFEQYGITLEKILSCFNFPFEKLSFSKAEETSYLKHNKLSNMFTAIADRIKYNNNLNDTNIPLFDLQAHQILDYFLEYYYEPIDELMDKLGVDLQESLLQDLEKAIYELDHEYFWKKYSIDIDEELEPQNPSNYKTIDFDNCSIIIKNPNTENSESFISFKDGIDFKKAIVDGKYKHSSTSRDILTSNIKTNKLYRISKIGGRAGLTEQILEKIIDNTDTIDQITIRFYDPESESDVFHVSFQTSSLFSTKDAPKKMSDVSPEVKKENNRVFDTPYLNKIGIDLTAQSYLKDPCVGREKELKALETKLLYPERDASVIITGPNGCGKSTLVEGLAYRIKKGIVPDSLKDTRIIKISSGDLVAGTQYVGTLEEKINRILNETFTNKNVVVFMDDIHQAIGAGKTSNSDNSVAELLKQHIGNGAIRIIGATSTQNYDYYSEENPGFISIFEEIKLPELDLDTMHSILDNLIESYNKFAKAKLSVSEEKRDMIIRWLLETTEHLVYNNKSSRIQIASRVIKHAYALADLDNRTEVTYDDIKEALMGEEKISKYTRETAVKALSGLKPPVPRDNVIDFNKLLLNMK